MAGLGHATGSGTSSPECSGAHCHHIAVPWLSPGHVFSELLPFFSCENEHCCAKQNRMNNDLECLLKHKFLAETEVAEWDKKQQIIVQSSDFHHILETDLEACASQ